MKSSLIGDLIVYCKYSLVNWIKIILLVLRHGLFDVVRDIRRYPWILVLLQVNSLLWRFIRGRTGRHREATAIVMSDIVSNTPVPSLGRYQSAINTGRKL